MKKIIDLQLNIDGIILEDGESIEDILNEVKSKIKTSYDIQYNILYEEEIE